MQATFKGVVKGAFVGKRRERKEKREKNPFQEKRILNWRINSPHSALLNALPFFKII
jgi:hypothetical protein